MEGLLRDIFSQRWIMVHNLLETYEKYNRSVVFYTFALDPQRFAGSESMKCRRVIFFCDLKSRFFFLMLFTVFRQASLNRIVFSNGFSTRFTNTCYLQCLHRLTDFSIAIYMQSAAHAKFSLFFTGI